MTRGRDQDPACGTEDLNMHLRKLPLALIGLLWASAAGAQDVLKAEAERVAVVAKVKPTVVAVFAAISAR